MADRRTILVVEDSEQVCGFLKELLSKHGWVVTAVASGAAALGLLGATEFCAVLCDLDLGLGPTGLDVLSRMPPKNNATPFVFLTAHGSAGRCREAFLLGAVDFLEKPVHPAVLLSTLDHVIPDSRDGLVDPYPGTTEDASARLADDPLGAAHVRRAIEIMERRYAEFDLTVAAIAAEVGVSPDHLARRFRTRTGRSPLDHLHDLRLSRAEELLVSSRLSIYEVARECGYRRNSEFSRWFRRLRGSTPSGFRGQ